jgi:hypothetical protein
MDKCGQPQELVLPNVNVSYRGPRPIVKKTHDVLEQQLRWRRGNHDKVQIRVGTK